MALVICPPVTVNPDPINENVPFKVVPSYDVIFKEPLEALVVPDFAKFVVAAKLCVPTASLATPTNEVSELLVKPKAMLITGLVIEVKSTSVYETPRYVLLTVVKEAGPALSVPLYLYEIAFVTPGSGSVLLQLIKDKKVIMVVNIINVVFIIIG